LVFVIFDSLNQAAYDFWRAQFVLTIFFSTLKPKTLGRSHFCDCCRVGSSVGSCSHPMIRWSWRLRY